MKKLKKKRGWHRPGLPVGKRRRIPAKEKKNKGPMYTTERMKLLLSEQDKSIRDKIRESLRGKNCKELRAIWEDECETASPFMRARMQHASDTELIEAIADIKLLRMKPRDFDVGRYYKNLFKGRQKGRAYRSFWEH